MDDIKSYLNELTQSGTATLHKSDDAAGLNIYEIRNKYAPESSGAIAVGLNGEIAYCSFSGLTNRKYARGEAIDMSSLKAFVQAVRNEKPIKSRSLFGKDRITFADSHIKFGQQV